MGLDAEIELVASYYHRFGSVPGGGPTTQQLKMVDGWPVNETRLHVATFRKHHWLHAYVCTLHEEANECTDVPLSSEELAAVANKLEEWVHDPEALPPCPNHLRRHFFGVFPDDSDYEDARDEYRADAKAEAAVIRKAIAWLGAKCESDERRAAIYRASW